MDTFFASAERADEQTLKLEIDAIVNSPVVQELLHSISGLIAVLDEHRQVVGLNQSFLQLLGVEDPEAVLGLRLGEAVECIHADEESGGCGTTRYCPTCGAAIATVTALATNQPAEQICALQTRSFDVVHDVSLLVRAHPLKVGGSKFLLLFLQDITLEQLRAALENTFFHDIGNMLVGLVGASNLLLSKGKDAEVVEAVRHSALRLATEVALQKCLFNGDISEFRVTRQEISTAQLLHDIKVIFANHEAAKHKDLVVLPCTPLVTQTDLSLALRVMCNMVANALEATDDNGTVKVWFEKESHGPVFCVWNRGAIPEAVQLRVFQRNYSTKKGDGRGIGTYSMKLLGEKILGGKVSFSSSVAEGTTFRFALGEVRRGRC